MAASLPTVHGRTAGKPRSLLAESTGMDARRPRPRGCISLVTFFVQAKKVTRPPRMAGEARQGRMPRQCDTRPKAKALGPRLRGDDEQNERSKWIPAFAGMTSTEALARMNNWALCQKTKKKRRANARRLPTRETKTNQSSLSAFLSLARRFCSLAENSASHPPFLTITQSR